MPAYHIAIVGYGIAGVAAAIALRREGHEITHFEARNVEPSGAGLLLQPVGLAALQELGVLEAVLHDGARVQSAVVLDDQGRRLVNLPYGERAVALGIRRRDLMRVLSEHDSKRGRLAHKRIIHIDSARGVLCSADGDAFGPFDLVIAADGWNSALRGALASEFGARIVHAVDTALVCVLHIPTETMTTQLVQKFAGAQHVSYWPVSAEHLAIAVNVPDNTFAEQTVDGFLAHAGTIEPLCRRWFAQQSRGAEIWQFRFGDVRVRRIAYQRVVLLGDAAHAMSPMLGLGASLAIEDALQLAVALRAHGDLAHALQRYAKQRRARVAPIQRLSRIVTPMINAQSLPAQWLRQRLFAQLMRFPKMAAWFMDRVS